MCTGLFAYELGTAWYGNPPDSGWKFLKTETNFDVSSADALEVIAEGKPEEQVQYSWFWCLQSSRAQYKQAQDRAGLVFDWKTKRGVWRILVSIGLAKFTGSGSCLSDEFHDLHRLAEILEEEEEEESASSITESIYSTVMDQRYGSPHVPCMHNFALMNVINSRQSRNTSLESQRFYTTRMYITTLTTRNWFPFASAAHALSLPCFEILLFVQRCAQQTCTNAPSRILPCCSVAYLMVLVCQRWCW